MRGSNQRGEGRLGLFITLVVIGVGIFIAVKYVPVKINAYEFRETLREEAKYMSVHRNEKEALERILERAEALEIPVTSKEIEIEFTKSEVIVSARFQQPIDFKVTTYTYRFDEELRAPLF